MNKKQAAERWEVSEYQVRKICKHMGINPKNIPEDTIPVYIPDKRYKVDPHRFYIFVLDVIINTHYQLEGIDNDIVETCIENLKQAELIVLKHGRSIDSLDYHDYLISPNRELFFNWKNANIKCKLEMIKPIVAAISEGVVAAMIS